MPFFYQTGSQVKSCYITFYPNAAEHVLVTKKHLTPKPGQIRIYSLNNFIGNLFMRSSQNRLKPGENPDYYVLSTLIRMSMVSNHYR